MTLWRLILQTLFVFFIGFFFFFVAIRFMTENVGARRLSVQQPEDLSFLCTFVCANYEKHEI